MSDPYAYVDLVRGTPLPRMFLATQTFVVNALANPVAELRARLAAQPGFQAIKPGMRIAVTAGSRGIGQIAVLTRAVVDALRDKGAHPCVVAAMGSHGGATAEGQKAVLASLGMTEESMSCPILSSMDTVEVGTLDNGMSVRMDKQAMACDGIIVMNRIKAHSAFRAPHESGLVKMLAIGLGNQSGADSCHAWGFGHMGRLIAEMAAVKIAACPITLGIGLIENSADGLADIVLLEPHEIIEKEKDALAASMRNMPRLPLGDPGAPFAQGDLDVLVVDAVGKEYASSGMDPNITGRYGTPFISGGPAISRIVNLRLTAKSEGNALGIGRADCVTESIFKAFDRNATYINALTAAFLSSSAIPLVMPTEKTAIQTAVKTCGARDMTAPRMLRIANTKYIQHFYASEAMLPELQNRPGVTIVHQPEPMRFDKAENLVDPWPQS